MIIEVANEIQIFKDINIDINNNLEILFADVLEEYGYKVEISSEQKDTIQQNIANEYVDDIEDLEDVEAIEAIEATKDTDTIEDIEDIEDIENVEDLEDLEDTEDVDDIEDTEDTEDITPIESNTDLSNNLKSHRNEIELSDEDFEDLGFDVKSIEMERLESIETPKKSNRSFEENIDNLGDTIVKAMSTKPKDLTKAFTDGFKSQTQDVVDNIQSKAQDKVEPISSQKVEKPIYNGTLRQFLKEKHGATLDETLIYFSRKEIDLEIRRGRIILRKNILKSL